MKKALIFGTSGQDGSYLAENLLDKGYEVHGVIRRHSTPSTERIDHIFDQLKLYYADLYDTSSIRRVLDSAQPDEIYNLGAQSHVRTSFDIPEYTGNVTGLGALRLFEAVKQSGVKPKIYQASSSEMFGASPPPQDELTPFYPRSPYGCSKAFAYWAAVNYRESYGMFISNGILFNHESPRRGETFVTRKITKALAAIIHGHQKELRLGNLDAKRDWGYAAEYVEAMHLMLQQDKPDDFVIATGQTHSVRDFLDEAFSYLGLRWRDYVVQDAKYFRPTEVDILLGNPTKAARVLGWKAKTSFRDLVRMMVDADMQDYICSKT